MLVKPVQSQSNSITARANAARTRSPTMPPIKMYRCCRMFCHHDGKGFFPTEVAHCGQNLKSGDNPYPQLLHCATNVRSFFEWQLFALRSIAFNKQRMLNYNYAALTFSATSRRIGTNDD